MKRTLLPVGLAVSLALAACAGRSEPPPSQQVHPAWLVGDWQGSGYQVDASKTQGEGQITMTFASGGAWKATTAAGTSSGASWLLGDRVVLDGVTPDGAHIRYTLKERDGAGGREMWGMVQASFGAALVSLKRVQ